MRRLRNRAFLLIALVAFLFPLSFNQSINAFLYQQDQGIVTQTIINVLFFDDFNEHIPPEAPDGWRILAGTWQTATDGSTVYEQIDTSVVSSGSAAGSTTWTDYFFEVKVKFVRAGSVAYRGAILAFRCQNSLNYYFLGIAEDRDLLLLYRRVWGFDILIASNSSTIVPNRWYTVRIKIEGQVINVWIDGVRYFTDQNSGGAIASGEIGLGTRYYHCRFDDVKVSAV